MPDGRLYGRVGLPRRIIKTFLETFGRRGVSGFSVCSCFCISRANEPINRPWLVVLSTVFLSKFQNSTFGLIFGALFSLVSTRWEMAENRLDQGYLDELKGTRILFGGGGLEQRYQVEAARRSERVCYLNLDHPTVPHWLWVNEVMFTDFGVQVPFTEFKQRLLNRASVAPSQLHPNAWASIRCFELVTEILQLP
ncbi:hypothetical protein PIB30_073207 [Stylosanthes scabra]|uniref:Uncharacterized protein n=1 Tax=Stylosanthes scabra TaxID=79078 RepID=A0ABU6RP77_9FABA|nr:hypothetical protein [Stylosanthes scabra]